MGDTKALSPNFFNGLLDMITLGIKKIERPSFSPTSLLVGAKDRSLESHSILLYSVLRVRVPMFKILDICRLSEISHLFLNL